MTLEFWFEFASTYSYPAAMRIEKLAAERGVPVVWRPFLLGPIFAAQGWGDSPFNIYAAKGRYMWRDLERICAALDLPLVKPSAFPRSGLTAARVAVAGANEPWLPAYVRAVYHASFALDRDVSDPAVVSGILDELRLPAAALMQAAVADEVKARLRAQTQTAHERGIFGAPSFLVGEELFWGNDRLEDALAWYARRTD